MSFSGLESAIRSMRSGTSEASGATRQMPRPPGSTSLTEAIARANQERFDELVKLARTHGVSCEATYNAPHLPEVEALLAESNEEALPSQGVIFSAPGEQNQQSGATVGHEERKGKSNKKSRGEGIKPNRIRQATNLAGVKGTVFWRGVPIGHGGNRRARDPLSEETRKQIEARRNKKNNKKNGR